MLNGALGRSLEYSMYSLGKLLKASFGIFWRWTLGHILGQTKAQKPLGPAAPQVFGLMSVLGCGLGFAFRKSLGGPSIFSLGSTLRIFSLGSTLSTLWKLHRCSIHHATSSAFPQIVPVYSIQYTVYTVQWLVVRCATEQPIGNFQLQGPVQLPSPLEDSWQIRRIEIRRIRIRRIGIRRIGIRRIRRTSCISLFILQCWSSSCVNNCRTLFKSLALFHGCHQSWTGSVE